MKNILTKILLAVIVTLTGGTVAVQTTDIEQGVMQRVGQTLPALSQWMRTGTTISPRNTGDSLRVDSLTNCNTIDTDAEGDLICGTDTGGGSVASDQLDFDEFENALNVDANTTITAGAFALTFDKSSVSGNFEIAGGALFDGPADYSISSIATSSGNRLVFTNRGGSDARYWFNTSSGNNVFSLSSGGTEYTAFGYVSNATRLISYNGIPIKFDFGGAGDANTDVTFSQDGTIISDDNVVVTNVLQVAGTATLSYSRFGTATTGHGLNASNDLLIAGDLEVDGDTFLDGRLFANTASLSALEVTGYASISNGFTIDPAGEDGVSISIPFEITGSYGASVSKLFGAGLTDCDTAATSKLLWDATNKVFSCGTDGGGSSRFEVGAGTATTWVSSISFDSGHFNISTTGSASTVTLDWGSGGPTSASQDEIIAGFWEYLNGVSVSDCSGCEPGIVTVGPAGSNADYVVSGFVNDEFNAAGIHCSDSTECGQVKVLEGTYIYSDVMQFYSSTSYTTTDFAETIFIASAQYNPVTACPSGGRCAAMFGDNPATNIDISGFTFDCNANNITGLVSDSSHRCLDFLHFDTINFHDNKIRNGINWSVFFRDGNHVKIERNQCYGGNNSEYDQNDCYHLRGVQNFDVLHNYCDTNGTGTSGDDCLAFGSADADTASTSHGLVKGNLFSSGSRGIEVLVDGPYDTNDITIADNIIFDTKRGGILFQDFEAGSSGRFMNIIVHHNTCDGIGTGGVEGDCIEVEQTVTPFTNAFKNLKITDNIIYDVKNGASTENAIAVAVAGEDLTISGNQMASISVSRAIRVGGSTRPVTGYTMIGNKIDCTNCNSGVVGVLLSGVSNGVFGTNYIKGHQTGATAGVVVDAHSDAAAIYNNVSVNTIEGFDTMILEQNTTANPNFNTYDNNVNIGNTTAHTLLGANSNYRFNNAGKWTAGADFILQDAGVSRFIFASTSLGRFGFGDVSPETFFEVASSSGITASISNVFSVDATNGRVDANGIVRSTRSGTSTQFVQINGGDSSGMYLTASTLSGVEKNFLINNEVSNGASTSNNVIAFQIDGVTQMIIDSFGRVGINDGTPTTLFDVGGNASIQANLEVTSRVIVPGLGATGVGDVNVCQDPTTFDLQVGAACAASTIKVKENIRELLPNDWLEQLNVVLFKYKGNFYGGKEDLGLIAEEVDKISPLLAIHATEDSKPTDLVQYKKGDPLAINWPAVNGLVIQELQEQQKKINEIQVPKSANQFNWVNLVSLVGGLLGASSFILRRRVA